MASGYTEGTGSCVKNSSIGKSQRIDNCSALVYLKLRKGGCPKKDALRFSSRKRCRTDSTIKVTGPQNYEILNRKGIDSNSLMIVHKGWVLGDPGYNLGNEFDKPGEVEGDNSEVEKKLNKHRIDRHDKKHEAYFNYMKVVNNFFQKEVKSNWQELEYNQLYHQSRNFRKDLNKTTENCLIQEGRRTPNSIDPLTKIQDNIKTSDTKQQIPQFPMNEPSLTNVFNERTSSPRKSVRSELDVGNPNRSKERLHVLTYKPPSISKIDYINNNKNADGNLRDLNFPSSMQAPIVGSMNLDEVLTKPKRGTPRSLKKDSVEFSANKLNSDLITPDKPKSGIISALSTISKKVTLENNNVDNLQNSREDLSSGKVGNKMGSESDISKIEHVSDKYQKDTDSMINDDENLISSKNKTSGPNCTDGFISATLSPLVGPSNTTIPKKNQLQVKDPLKRISADVNPKTPLYVIASITDLKKFDEQDKPGRSFEHQDPERNQQTSTSQRFSNSLEPTRFSKRDQKKQYGTGKCTFMLINTIKLRENKETWQEPDQFPETPSSPNFSGKKWNSVIDARILGAEKDTQPGSHVSTSQSHKSSVTQNYSHPVPPIISRFQPKSNLDKDNSNLNNTDRVLSVISEHSKEFENLQQSKLQSTLDRRDYKRSSTKKKHSKEIKYLLPKISGIPKNAPDKPHSLYIPAVNFSDTTNKVAISPKIKKENPSEKVRGIKVDNFKKVRTSLTRETSSPQQISHGPNPSDVFEKKSILKKIDTDCDGCNIVTDKDNQANHNVVADKTSPGKQKSNRSKTSTRPRRNACISEIPQLNNSNHSIVADKTGPAKQKSNRSKTSSRPRRNGCIGQIPQLNNSNQNPTKDGTVVNGKKTRSSFIVLKNVVKNLIRSNRTIKNGNGSSSRSIKKKGVVEKSIEEQIKIQKQRQEFEGVMKDKRYERTKLFQAVAEKSQKLEDILSNLDMFETDTNKYKMRSDFGLGACDLLADPKPQVDETGQGSASKNNSIDDGYLDKKRFEDLRYGLKNPEFNEDGSLALNPFQIENKNEQSSDKKKEFTGGQFFNRMKNIANDFNNSVYVYEHRYDENDTKNLIQQEEQNLKKKNYDLLSLKTNPVNMKDDLVRLTKTSPNSILTQIPDFEGILDNYLAIPISSGSFVLHECKSRLSKSIAGDLDEKSAKQEMVNLKVGGLKKRRLSDKSQVNADKEKDVDGKLSKKAGRTMEGTKTLKKEGVDGKIVLVGEPATDHEVIVDDKLDEQAQIGKFGNVDLDEANLESKQENCQNKSFFFKKK